MSVASPALDQARMHETLRSTEPKGAGKGSRLREEGLEDTSRNYSVAMHLSPLAVLLIGFPFAIAAPLVLWLIRKDKSTFEDDHGREIMNFLISYLLLGLIFIWTGVIPVILAIVGLVSMIRGAVAAGNGEYFRYPMTFRFLS